MSDQSEAPARMELLHTRRLWRVRRLRPKEGVLTRGEAPLVSRVSAAHGPQREAEHLLRAPRPEGEVRREVQTARAVAAQPCAWVDSQLGRGPTSRRGWEQGAVSPPSTHL